MYRDEILCLKSFNVGQMVEVAVEMCRQALKKFMYKKQSGFIDLGSILLQNYPGYAVGCFVDSTTAFMINVYVAVIFALSYLTQCLTSSG